MTFRIQWALLCCTWSRCGGEMPNTRRWTMPLEGRLWTGTPSFLMHSVDQNKSQVLTKFNRWGHRSHASTGELGRIFTKHPQAFFVASSTPIAQQNQSLCSHCSVVKSPGRHTTILLFTDVYIHCCGLNVTCPLQAPVWTPTSQLWALFWKLQYLPGGGVSREMDLWWL